MLALFAFIFFVAAAVPIGAVWKYQDWVETKLRRAGTPLHHPTIREFLTNSKNRLWLWTLGVVAALLPNAAGLYGSWKEWTPTSSSVLGTAASVLLISAMSFTDMARTLWRTTFRRGRRRIARIVGTTSLAVLCVSFGIYFTWLANKFPNGIPEPPPWLWPSLFGSIALSVIAEMWMAYSALLEEKA